MMKINFQKYKKLHRFTQILVHDIENDYNISLRRYCQNIIISSISPQEESCARRDSIASTPQKNFKDKAESKSKRKIIINLSPEKNEKNTKKHFPGEGFQEIFKSAKSQNNVNHRASSTNFPKVQNTYTSEKYVKKNNDYDSIHKISNFHFKLLNEKNLKDPNFTGNVPDMTNLTQDDYVINEKRHSYSISDPMKNCVKNEQSFVNKEEEIIKSNLSSVNAEWNDSNVPLNIKNENLESAADYKPPVFSRYKMLESSKEMIEYDLSADKFDVNEFVQQFDSVEKPLDECNEDLSDYAPNLHPTFNFAAYADKSELIQKFVKLNVKLYQVEKNQNHMRVLLSVDKENDLPKYIQFLHDCGVPSDCLGDVITANPMIFKEDMDDLKTRIRYLRAHDFEKEDISRIITKNPKWLSWATKYIDERLGHFQSEFKLKGEEVRFLATKQPKLITFNFKHIHENTFAVREEMGFNRPEMKVILLSKPRLWMNSRKKILDSFDYLHNTMKLSHLTIASQADILTCRRTRLQNRHEFLVELKKVQYDPSKPGYIAPKSFVSGSDAEFCRDIAKTALETYNLFLKTR